MTGHYPITGGLTDLERVSAMQRLFGDWSHVMLGRLVEYRRVIRIAPREGVQRPAT